MAEYIPKASIVKAVGNKPKVIEEFVGKVNTSTSSVSIARMKSPSGWEEPGQQPDFDEYTVVLNGSLTVETKAGKIKVNAGEAIYTKKGEWVRYSTPGEDGAEYMAVCLPAFSPEAVHRDE